MNSQSISYFLKKNLAIISIFLLAIVIRWYAVQGNSVLFWYDQARDLTIVRDIVVNHDFKVQGPSASGTNDTFYHGVLYYYILAPFYLLSSGDPQIISYALAILGSFSVLIIYLLGVSVFKSKPVGLLAAIFLSVSSISVHQATWLSNPQMLVISLGLFYYSIWKIFFEKPRLFHFILVGVSLGMSVQSGLFELFLIGSIVAIYIRRSIQENKLVLFSIKQISAFLVSFFISISSIIITQWLMIHRRVLTIEKLSTIKTERVDAATVLDKILEYYINSIQLSLIPTGIVLLFLMLLILIYIGYKNSDSKIREWGLLILTGPLWLLTVQYRGSLQILIGIEVLLYLLLAAGLLKIRKISSIGSIIFYAICLIFIVTNLYTLRQLKMAKVQYYGIQKGSFLVDQLELIDKTYELAEGQDFSISTSTNPYAINVTWGYLYNWYGRKKYGYVPHYFGMSQAGYVGEGLLPEVIEPNTRHFVIMEPDTGLSSRILNEFIFNQDLKSTSSSANIDFGTLELQNRIRN